MAVFCFLCLLAVLVASPVLHADEEFIDGDLFEMRDVDGDGRVSQSEFGWGRNVAVNEAFACLDTDMNGYISRSELDTQRARFEDTHLANSDGKEVKVWMLTDTCLGDYDIGRNGAELLRSRIFGSTMWEYLVAPWSLELQQRLPSSAGQAALLYGVCKEMAGFGCLQGPSSRPPSGYLSGAVSGAAFAERQRALAPGIPDHEVEAAFSCFRPQQDLLSPQQFFQTRSRYYRSWLASLSVSEVITWVSELPCHVGASSECHFDLYSANQAMRLLDLNGPALFTFALANPGLLSSKLLLADPALRLALIQAQHKLPPLFLSSSPSSLPLFLSSSLPLFLSSSLPLPPLFLSSSLPLPPSSLPLATLFLSPPPNLSHSTASLSSMLLSPPLGCAPR